MSSLITAEELHIQLSSDNLRPKVLDVRWRLDRPNGHPEFLQGHIPSAVYVDLDHELAEHGQPATEGRHPLPTVETLQQAARRWGLNPGDAVVIYDDAQSMAAARAWWVLRHAGISDVRVLDGAWPAWRDAGYPVETGDITPEEGSIALGSAFSTGHLGMLSMDEAATFSQHGVLVDVRAPERYRGEHEPMDPRAGHIPGAINAPTGANLDDDGRFLPPEQLKERFASLGVTPGTEVACYCGSGVTAAHSILALETAGIRASLYPGSFSQWANHPDRPVAASEEPSLQD